MTNKIETNTNGPEAPVRELRKLVRPVEEEKNMNSSLLKEQILSATGAKVLIQNVRNRSTL